MDVEKVGTGFRLLSKIWRLKLKKKWVAEQFRLRNTVLDPLRNQGCHLYVVHSWKRIVPTSYENKNNLQNLIFIAHWVWTWSLAIKIWNINLIFCYILLLIRPVMRHVTSLFLNAQRVWVKAYSRQVITKQLL